MREEARERDREIERGRERERGERGEREGGRHFLTRSHTQNRKHTQTKFLVNFVESDEKTGKKQIKRQKRKKDKGALTPATFFSSLSLSLSLFYTYANTLILNILQCIL